MGCVPPTPPPMTRFVEEIIPTRDGHMVKRTRVTIAEIPPGTVAVYEIADVKSSCRYCGVSIRSDRCANCGAPRGGV
jgi:hypothetical protein